ncbi:MAG: class I SAM-dependent methyltransferase [Cyclobacteriaceae bacterium]
MGYYELTQKPNEKELRDYYANKYYQNEEGAYSKEYTTEELKYFSNKIEQKYEIIKAYFSSKKTNTKSLLDIGCGEGFGMNFFWDKGWNVQGLDFSKYGCEHMNPEMSKYLTTGNIYENMEKLIQSNEKFSVLWMINVLEHVTDPLSLLEKCKKLIEDDGIMVIEVPNDFSSIQMELLEKSKISEPFWVVVPDHISYFNVNGLRNLLHKTGWDTHDVITDFPIDFALHNVDTNYIKDNTKGKNVHFSRVGIENHLHQISIEKTNALYRAYADLGLGRQINGFFTKAKT